MNSRPPDSRRTVIYILMVLYILQVLSFLKFGILRIGKPPIFSVFFLLFIVTCVKFRLDHFPSDKKVLSFTPLIVSLFFLFEIFNRNGQIWWGLTPFYAKPDYAPFVFLSIFQWLSFPIVLIYVRDAIMRISGILFSRIGKGIVPGLAFSACLFLAFMMFRERGISRDGMDWVRTTENNTWYLYLREVYTMLIFRVLHVLMKGFGMTARDSIAIASSVSGVVFVWIMIKIYSSQPEASGGNQMFYILGIFSSYGLAQIFFGQIEVYGLFIAAVCGYFLLAISYLDRKIKLRFIGIYYALMMGIHIAAIWLLPSLLLLPGIRNKWGNGCKDACGRETLTMLFLVILTGAILLFPIACLAYDFRVLTLWQRGFQSVTDTPDARVFLSFKSMFSIRHAIDLANIFFHSWGGIFFLGLCLFLRKTIGKNWGKRDAFVLSALIPALVFALTYRLGRTAMEDWNSFSLLTFVMAFFAVQRIFNRGNINLKDPEYMDLLTVILVFNCQNLYLILCSGTR